MAYIPAVQGSVRSFLYRLERTAGVGLVSSRGIGQSNSRGISCEFVHVCIDDPSRLAFSQIVPDERKGSAIAFLNAALAHCKSLGVTVAR